MENVNLPIGQNTTATALHILSKTSCSILITHQMVVDPAIFYTHLGAKSKIVLKARTIHLI